MRKRTPIVLPSRDVRQGNETRFREWPIVILQANHLKLMVVLPQAEATVIDLACGTGVISVPGNILRQCDKVLEPPNVSKTGI